MPDFYEFFAGGGMARAGLGVRWRCLLANDFDLKKAATYRVNWGADAMRAGDVRDLRPGDLPGSADLAWGSFPCQDLSLAGGGAGLQGERSGTFWPFWKLMMGLRQEGRAPRLVVLENVCGALTSHGGKDFAAISGALSAGGYRFGALVIDAALFLPQSRPRLFFVACRRDVELPPGLVADAPQTPWHTGRLCSAHANLDPSIKDDWLWWRLPPPPRRAKSFLDMIEAEPTGVEWHTAAETARLLSMMTPLNLAKVEDARRSGRPMVGGVYKRTRPTEGEGKAQRAEIRFDEMSGCLRTPSGGSSRQVIVVVDGEQVRSRLISTRETARLMGLHETYILPNKYNEAYHLTGDGVAVPVVRHLAEHLLEPIVAHGEVVTRAAA